MFKILEKKALNEQVSLIKIEANLIAKKAKAGQFVIVRANDESERIPLTIHDHDANSITLIYQIVGASTYILDTFKEGDYLKDVVGPLGEASHLEGYKNCLVVGGGLGTAISYPIAKALKENGAKVTAVNGFRTKDLVILEDKFDSLVDKHILTTDDGSYKASGLVTDHIKELIKYENYDLIFVVGPLMMMKYVYLTVKDTNSKILVSMNPIMIDGTGMCGGCRLTVNGKMRFACVDGPDFDAREIDFDEAILRSKAYQDIERHKYEEKCNLFKREAK